MFSNQPVRAYPKSAQLHSKRQKLTRRQRSELPPKEVKRLYERSNGVCEACDKARATEKAHLERRWKSESRPTAEDFLHLCDPCHDWADSCKDGRAYLLDQRERLRNGEKPQLIRDWRIADDHQQ